MTHKKNWTVEIEDAGDGDAWIPIPDEILSKLGWQIYDEIDVVDIGPGRLSFRKVDSITPDQLVINSKPQSPKSLLPFAELLDTLNYAADRHIQQRRKGATQEPYINHLIEVAYLLATVAKVQDINILNAAILHDVIEDTDATLQEISDLFGARVTGWVAALTDDKTQPKDERKQQVLEHLPTADQAVRLIKLADLCSNVASIPDDWDAARVKAYRDWAQQAATLCAGISPELDAVFKARNQFFELT